MTNSQLSSIKQEHYTPLGIIDRCRWTLSDPIDLDPASNHVANSIIRANRFYSKADNSLERSWLAKNVFLNPPGGKRKNKSLSALFWDKFISEHRRKNFLTGFFLGFSLELISKRPGILYYPTLFFANMGEFAPDYLTKGGRVKFLDQELHPQKSPTHGNFLTIVSRNPYFYERFKISFRDSGVIAIGQKPDAND